jgi:hypothetical protein
MAVSASIFLRLMIATMSRLLTESFQKGRRRIAGQSDPDIFVRLALRRSR